MVVWTGSLPRSSLNPPEDEGQGCNHGLVFGGPSAHPGAHPDSPHSNKRCPWCVLSSQEITSALCQELGAETKRYILVSYSTSRPLSKRTA